MSAVNDTLVLSSAPNLISEYVGASQDPVTLNPGASDTAFNISLSSSSILRSETEAPSISIDVMKLPTNTLNVLTPLSASTLAIALLNRYNS